MRPSDIAEPAAVTPADGIAASPLDRLTQPVSNDPMRLAAALADAAAAIARLDQALAGHKLAQALLYRARLVAVREQAAADGAVIDPWHLAATIEGLRLRMDPYVRIIDRGEILDRARQALALHQWLVEPDFDQEGEIRRAEFVLHGQPAALPPLIAAARGFREWIECGNARPAMRAALVRLWQKRQLLRLPIPLTGAAALRAGRDWAAGDWEITFLRAMEREAAEALDLLYNVERGWLDARSRLGRRRKDANDAAAVDLLAAAPAVSATTLSRILGIAVKNAIRILDDLVGAEIAIEITHRSKRRLFGLKNLAPLRDVVRPPYRPAQGPGRGQYPRYVEAPIVERDTAFEKPPLPPLETHMFDYTALEAAMAQLDAVVRTSRSALRSLVDGTHGAGGNSKPNRAEAAPDC